MRVLMCHNYYQQRGGEDQSFEDEADLLEQNGHDVVRYTLHNDEIRTRSRLDVAWRTVWNPTTYHELRSRIARVRPDVVHFTNSFPLISPSAYFAAQAEKVPILHALRDFRLLCPQGHFLRNHEICESCLTKSLKLPSIVHGCYRGSRAGSVVVSTMIAAHHALRTWGKVIDRYYCASRFARSKFIEGGFPAGRIGLKPNFVFPDPGVGQGSGGYAIFAARLSPEKGLRTLLDAWSRLEHPIPLKIAGDGEEAGLAREYSRTHPEVEWLGFVPLKKLMPLVAEASVMIVPSTWYETFGRTIIEAFATGTPVIATRMGAMEELITEGENGYFFERADADGLAARVGQLMADPIRLQHMRRNARAEFEQSYTPAANYRFFRRLLEETVERRSAVEVDRREPVAELV
jgi:glycosyltransferase involved in cell wall biosynthesis